MKSRSLGFTLVELLIVIVVIAILASISVVAYNGIQKRARETTVQSGLSNLMKAIEVENAQTGSYPTNARLKQLVSEVMYNGNTPNFTYVYCRDTANNYAVIPYEPLKPQPSSGTLYYISSTAFGNVKSGTYTTGGYGGGSGGMCTTALPSWYPGGLASWNQT